MREAKIATALAPLEDIEHEAAYRFACSGPEERYGIIALSDPVNGIDPSGLLVGGLVNAGEGFGTDAAEYYAQKSLDPCASGWEKAGAWAGGFFASLWTPETSDATFWTLASFAGFRWQGIPVEPTHIGFDVPFTKLNLIHYGRHIEHGRHIGVLFRRSMETWKHIYFSPFRIWPPF